MSVGCLSAAQNSSMGDDGIAMKDNPRYDGDSGQGEKFEGTAPSKNVSAEEAQNSGRQ